jgi:hypothetical protein
LETEYWPEWNEHFARPVADFPNHHRALTEQLNLAAILSHVEDRVIGNDYTISFAGRRYQILRSQVQAGMRRQRLRNAIATARLASAWPTMCLSSSWTISRGVICDMVIRFPVFRW